MKYFLILTLTLLAQLSFGEIGDDSAKIPNSNPSIENFPRFELELIPLNLDYWTVDTLCYNGCDEQGKAIAVSIPVRYGRLYKVNLEFVQEGSCKREEYTYEKPICEYLGM